MLMEAWHGLDLPPNVPLPKQFVAALVKQKKNLTGFGFSRSSATFYFEDGCWLRTQLYSDEWPDVSVEGQSIGSTDKRHEVSNEWPNGSTDERTGPSDERTNG